MRLDTKALAIALGLLWGGSILVVGLAATWLGADGDYYGKDFLLAVASIYPGYRGVPAVGDVIVGALYGLLDGAICGALLGWLYNLMAKPRASA